MKPKKKESMIAYEELRQIVEMEIESFKKKIDNYFDEYDYAVNEKEEPE